MAGAKIVQVCNSGFYLTRFLRPLVTELVARSWEVHCVCNFSERDRAAIERVVPGAQLHNAVFPNSPSPVEFAVSIASIWRLFRTLRPDVVNSHNRNASIAARLAARLAHVPWNIYTAHGFYFHDGQGRFKRSIAIAMERALARITDFTLSQSSEDTVFSIEKGICSADAIETIGNGIDLCRFAPLTAAPVDRRSGEAFHIVTTGRLVRQKGFQDLIAALARIRSDVPGARLTMIGGNIEQERDPYRAELERMIEKRDLSGSVTVTGLTDEVPKYLAGADLFVLPSYREGLPRSLIEAMSMGLPVVATDIRGCRECIRPGENGYLYPPGDVGALAAILRKLAWETDLAAFGRASRKLALERFSETDYIQRQITALERIALNRPSSESSEKHL